jgi:hypothetical protein
VLLGQDAVFCSRHLTTGTNQINWNHELGSIWTGEYLNVDKDITLRLSVSLLPQTSISDNEGNMMAGKRSLSDAEPSGGAKKRVLLSTPEDPPAANGDVETELEVRRRLIERVARPTRDADAVLGPVGVQKGGDMAPDARIQAAV